MENHIRKKTGFKLKPLFYYLKPYYHWIILSIIASFSYALIEIYIAKLLQVLIDTAVKVVIHDVIKTAIILSLAVLLGVIAQFLRNFSTGRFSVRAIRDIRNHAVEKLSHSSFSDSEAEHTGTIVSKLTNNIGIVQNFLENNLSNLIYLPIICIGSLTIMALISWKMLLINLAILILTLVIISIQGRPLQNYSKELQAYLATINAVVQDLIRGIPIIKAFNLYDVLFKKYNSSVNQSLDKTLQIVKRVSMVIPIGNIAGFLPLIASIVIGGYLVIMGEFTTGGLIVNIYLLEFLSSSLNGIPQLIIGINVLSGASIELNELLNKPSERTGGKKSNGLITTLAIEFEGVSYSYHQSTPVLNDLSFQVSTGETIAIVGHSGSGKSTILKLLCGYYELQKGQIRLNGDLLSELELKSARSLISVVSQNIFLFPVSIKENISYGKSGATIDEIESAVKTANLDKLIAKLPQGYDTIVGERGARLSGGEKQRISIARAILKDTPIILLDEPTSSLDKESESLILDALNNLLKNRTAVIVTHKLTGIKNVSRILVLDKGTIVESGIHDTLISTDSIYKKLYYNQIDLN